MRPEDIVRRAFSRLVQSLTGPGFDVWTFRVTEAQEAHLTELLEALKASRGRVDTFTSNLFWEVYYTADALPEAEGWAKVSTGAPEATAASGILTVVDDSTSESVYWTYELNTVSPNVPTIVEFRLRVLAATTGVNRGACVSLCNGAYQFVVWFRATGLNVDGQPEVSVDFTQYRRVRLVCRGTWCKVFVDGELRQGGTWINETSKREVSFGSTMPPP